MNINVFHVHNKRNQNFKLILTGTLRDLGGPGFPGKPGGPGEPTPGSPCGQGRKK